MNADLETIRNVQKDSWDKFSPSWRKWDQLIMSFLQPYVDAIIRP